MTIVTENKPEVLSEIKTIRTIDLTQIIVFVITLLTSIITVTGLFFWSRSESASDRREIEALIYSMRQEASSMHQETYLEMKDFHGRLCEIEAGKKIGGETR